jgi:hypothetical protein
VTDIMTDPAAPSAEPTARDLNLAALKAFIAWAEEHPAARTDITDVGAENTLFRILHPVWNRQELAQIARAIGGQWDKRVDGSWFWLAQEVVPGVTYELYINRNLVCERVVTGTETVTVTEPDPELVAGLPTVTRTETREIVEWVCPDSVLAGAQVA